MKPLKLIIITQGVSRIIEPLLTSNHKVVGFVESATRDEVNKKVPNVLYKIARFFYSKIKKQVITLKELAEGENIPYRYMLSSNDTGLEEWLINLKPDLVIVFSMSQLLKENIFSIPALGTINMHPSMLPDYRGPNPDLWQYINLEMNPGVTIHYIDKGEDTGDILNQERVNIPLGTKSPERLDKLIGEVGVRNLLKTIDELANGIALTVIQPKESTTVRARNINIDEHKELIKWESWETSHIWHVLRGTELWLNALEQPKGLYKGQRWIVGNYQLLEKQPIPTKTIYKMGSQYAVATKDGYIEIAVKINIKSLIVSCFN